VYALGTRWAYGVEANIDTVRQRRSGAFGMDTLAALSLDLQLLLVGGFFAYKISVVGTQTEDSTEELLLKVVAFGLFGRLIYELLVMLLDVRLDVSLLRSTVVGGIGVVCMSILAGVVWRRWLARLAARTLNVLRVHRDDHFRTTWDSIVNQPAQWDYVQLHLSNGSVVESDFGAVPADVPLGKLTLSTDGVSLYITRIHRDGTTSNVAPAVAGRGFVASYIPKEQITQVDFCWRRLPTA
jgi:hypothetical protein